MTIFIRRSGVFLLQVENHKALFLVSGKRILLNSKKIDSDLKVIWDKLPDTWENISSIQPLFSTVSESKINDVLDFLKKAKIIFFCEEPTHKLPSEKSPKSLALEHFFDSFFKSSKASQKLVQTIEKTSLRFISFSEIHPMFFSEFKQGLFQSVDIQNSLDEEKLSTPNSDHWDIAIGSWADLEHFQTFNKMMNRHKRVWLPVLLDPYGFTLGPVLGLEYGPCFNCLVERRISNFSDYDHWVLINQFYSTHGSSNKLFRHPSIDDMAGKSTHMEILKLVTQFLLPESYSSMIEFDLIHYQSSTHTIHPTPFCEVCGSSNGPFETNWTPSGEDSQAQS